MQTWIPDENNRWKSRLVVMTDPIRPEKELIWDLKARLNCIMNEWVNSPIIDACIKKMKIQLQNLGVPTDEINKIG